LIRDQKIFNGLATFSAGYIKRWLEGNVYDRIFKTELGKKLKSIDKKAKYGIEFGLNLLTAFFDQKLVEDTALKSFVKQVGIDTGPEISKRLLNNTKTQEEKELVSVLLELEPPCLINLLNWLYDTEANERTEILKHLSQLSSDELMKFAQLKDEDRKRLFNLFKSEEKSKENKALLSPKVTQDIQMATTKIEEIRKKFRERSKRR
jgi:hypothetical protein